MNWSVTVGTIAAALLFASSESAAQGRTISGKAFVFDANTLEVRGEKIRLFGVDAPDRKQTCLSEKRKSYPCGLRAAFALDNLAKGKVVVCQARGIDSRNKILATCSHAGLDIGGAMVEAGWAIADRRYSEMYVKTESAAAEGRRGMWQGEFEEPQSWRRLPRPLETE